VYELTTNKQQHINHTKKMMAATVMTTINLTGISSSS